MEEEKEEVGKKNHFQIKITTLKSGLPDLFSFLDFREKKVEFKRDNKKYLNHRII